MKNYKKKQSTIGFFFKKYPLQSIEILKPDCNGNESDKWENLYLSCICILQDAFYPNLICISETHHSER